VVPRTMSVSSRLFGWRTRKSWPWKSAGRRSADRQRNFDFLVRAERIERNFKVAIILASVLVIAGAFASTSTGRNLASWLAMRAKWMMLRSIGSHPARDEIDADWRRRRLFDIEQSRKKLRSDYDNYNPAIQKLLRFAGLDPDHALLRWGNFDRTLLLPATLFEPDDRGRSYRMKPHTQAVWIRNLAMREGSFPFFMVPDALGLASVLEETRAEIIPNSRQTTNSWGLRGPEPDLSATLRGIVLGDSFMQGLFVGDEETAPECVRHYLEERLKERVAILNTGHLGYSPEQYYYTLLEYADRFHPRFVVVSVCANDFGNLFEVVEGIADWEEGGYWLGRIQQFCRLRNLLLLVVPAPYANHIEKVRLAGFFPGQVSNVLHESGLFYLDPFEEFVDKHLELMNEGPRRENGREFSPLFNSQIADAHFSVLGSKLWGSVVGRRLINLLKSFEVNERAPQ
jgi:hypothetical protein